MGLKHLNVSMRVKEHFKKYIYTFPAKIKSHRRYSTNTWNVGITIYGGK